MSESEVIKGHCPECGPDRNADVRGHHRTTYEEDEHGIWARNDYRILVCRGCDSAYFQMTEIFSENIDHRLNSDGQWEAYIPEKVVYYPSPTKRTPPTWLFDVDLYDFSLGDLLRDIYKCVDADLRIPAAIAARTAFDRAAELLQIDNGLPFSKKLKALEDLGKISADEHDVLNVLIDAGSAAAHRGWKPKPEELQTLISLLESFVHRTFVLGEAARKLQQTVPKRPQSI